MKKKAPPCVLLLDCIHTIWTRGGSRIHR